jgi:thioredoxin-dependent peroxiredoxin
MLNNGQKFPDFNLENQDGKSKTLKDYAGQWLVLYVYPKDDTPGCSKESPLLPQRPILTAPA